MGWLRTLRNGVPFVTAPSPLLDPLCLATLNTGIPFVESAPCNSDLDSDTMPPAVSTVADAQCSASPWQQARPDVPAKLAVTAATAQLHPAPLTLPRGQAHTAMLLPLWWPPAL
eukprot:366166-Chlamydomonas_euryale.AAC.15